MERLIRWSAILILCKLKRLIIEEKKTEYLLLFVLLLVSFSVLFSIVHSDLQFHHHNHQNLSISLLKWSNCSHAQ